MQFHFIIHFGYGQQMASLVFPVLSRYLMLARLTRKSQRRCHEGWYYFPRHRIEKVYFRMYLYSTIVRIWYEVFTDNRESFSDISISSHYRAIIPVPFRLHWQFCNLSPFSYYSHGSFSHSFNFIPIPTSDFIFVSFSWDSHNIPILTGNPIHMHRCIVSHRKMVVYYVLLLLLLLWRLQSNQFWAVHITHVWQAT